VHRFSNEARPPQRCRSPPRRAARQELVTTAVSHERDQEKVVLLHILQSRAQEQLACGWPPDSQAADWIEWKPCFDGSYWNNTYETVVVGQTVTVFVMADPATR
jgi:hypothetical protein